MVDSDNAPRIISLLPGATEMVAEAGLADFLVGVSHECDYPRQIAGLPRLTSSVIPSGLSSAAIDEFVRARVAKGKGLYRLDHERVRALEPNLIVTQGLCEVCAVSDGDVRSAIGSMVNPPQIVSLNPMCLREVLTSMLRIGKAAGSEEIAAIRVEALEQRIANVEFIGKQLKTSTRVLILEWLAPPFSAGHWNPELVELAGGTSLLSTAGMPSRQIAWDAISGSGAEVLIVAACGHDLERVCADLQKVLRENLIHDMPAIDRGRVWAVDGSQYLNRSGPRLVDSLEIIAHILSPEQHVKPACFEGCTRRFDVT